MICDDVSPFYMERYWFKFNARNFYYQAIVDTTVNAVTSCMSNYFRYREFNSLKFKLFIRFENLVVDVPSFSRY